jgi:PTH2 family peptidyl-tRNA hydrolase
MIPHMDNKMVFAVRTDVGMKKGKVAAQCAHAAVRCYKNALLKTPDYLRGWEMFGETKVALKIDSEEAIREVQAKAEAKGLAVAVIRDAGFLACMNCIVTKAILEHK